MKIERAYTKSSTGESFTVEVEIDLEEIARALAARAITSKGGKAQALGGDIKCRVIERSNAPATAG